MPIPINRADFADGILAPTETTGRSRFQLDEQIVPMAQVCDVQDTPYRTDGHSFYAYSVGLATGGVGEHAAVALTFAGAAATLPQTKFEVRKIWVSNAESASTTFIVSRFNGLHYAGWTHGTPSVVHTADEPFLLGGLAQQGTPFVIEPQVLTTADFNTLDNWQGSVLPRRFLGAELTSDGSGMRNEVLDPPIIMWNKPRSGGVSPGGLIIAGSTSGAGKHLRVAFGGRYWKEVHAGRDLEV